MEKFGVSIVEEKQKEEPNSCYGERGEGLGFVVSFEYFRTVGIVSPTFRCLYSVELENFLSEKD